MWSVWSRQPKTEPSRWSRRPTRMTVKHGAIARTGLWPLEQAQVLDTGARVAYWVPRAPGSV